MTKLNKYNDKLTAIYDELDDLIALDIAESYKPQIKKLQYIIDFLYTHNKNYTKKQWDCIIELKELVEEGSAEK